MGKIVVATKNAGKLEELKAMLCGLPFEFVGQSEIAPQIEVEEDGATFEENALKKARALCRATGLAAIADDSGLCVDALGGEPGVYSARYAGEGKTDRDRIAKVLGKLEGKRDRTAHFTCALAFCGPDGLEFSVSGHCHGVILDSSRGEGGFGYDPIFYFPPLGKSFGELPPEIKDGVSHRANAMKIFIEKLKQVSERQNRC